MTRSDRAGPQAGDAEYLLQTRVPVALGRWLKLFAAKRYTSMAAITREALEAYRTQITEGSLSDPPPVNSREAAAYTPRRGGARPQELADGEQMLRHAVTLPRGLATWVREYAVLEGVSLTQVVSEALTIYRNAHDPH